MQLMNRVEDLETDNSTIIKIKNLTETLNTRYLLFAENDASDMEAQINKKETVPGVVVFVDDPLMFDEILDVHNVLTDNTTINIRASGRWCCDLDLESGDDSNLEVELVRGGTDSVPGGFTRIALDDQGSLHTCFEADNGETFQYVHRIDAILLRSRLVCAIYEYDPLHRD